jgi:hypothetical protein
MREELRLASTVRISQAITVVVCGAGLLCACGLGPSYKPPPPPPTVPETSISATRLYFEAAAGTESPVQQVTLTNLGSEPLGIVRQALIKSGEEYAMTTTCAKVLAPSASCVLSVKFQPRPEFKSEHYGIILIDMADYERHRVYLHGKVTEPEGTEPLAPK